MRLDRADRRRLAFASTLTVAALPAIWLVNRDDTRSSATRPNVAAVGLAAEDGSAGRTGAAAAPLDGVDPMGDGDPLFGDEQSAAPAPRRASVTVGSADEVVASALATHSRSAGFGDTCPYSGLPAGTDVKVVNPANGRSIECVTSPSERDETVLVLHPDRFVLLASLVAAPVRVEIHQ